MNPLEEENARLREEVRVLKEKLAKLEGQLKRKASERVSGGFVDGRYAQADLTTRILPSPRPHGTQG